MKTNVLKILGVAFFCSAVTMSGSLVIAQSDPDEPSFQADNMNIVFERLDALMIQFEEAARYVAPSGEYDEVDMSLERLEHLADQIENEMMYQAPDFESIQKFRRDKMTESSSLLSHTKKSIPVQFKN